MSHDTATIATDTQETNVRVIQAIKTHHAQLARELDALTAAVLGAARKGDCTVERSQLHDWYRTELVPHAAAEEQALYNRASDLDTTSLLVRGMIAEHVALVSLIDKIAVVEQPLDVANTAASAQALFTIHLGKENDLLLPAMNSAGIDLAAALDGMHEILGHGEPSEAEGCGCGCGCEHGDEAPSAVTVQLTSAPADFPPAAPAPAAATVTATPDGDELDVRALPHGQRHNIIFAKLDALAPGEAFFIVNDHDPKPLRYQTEALWPGRFEWTYLEAGPRVWRLSIRNAD